MLNDANRDTKSDHMNVKTVEAMIFAVVKQIKTHVAAGPTVSSQCDFGPQRSISWVRQLGYQDKVLRRGLASSGYYCGRAPG